MADDQSNQDDVSYYTDAEDAEDDMMSLHEQHANNQEAHEDSKLYNSSPKASPRIEVVVIDSQRKETKSETTPAQPPENRALKHLQRTMTQLESGTINQWIKQQTS